MALSRQAAAAKMIRQELQRNGVRGSVTSESFAGGNAVRVRIEQDVLPAVYEQIRSFAGQFQYGHFDGMHDIYEYSNGREDIPQAKYVSVEIEYSAEIKAAAREYVMSYFGEENGYRIDDLVWQVLNGSRGHFWRDRKPRVRVAA